ncbi:MAG TPA: hypothetical protein VFS34_03345 [Thermoanaerobaculia bacterium]|nr:hypothetical protein [Thermoanaerobaculia bacterium]
MRDDEETGAEHDTYDSNDPDRDRETAQGARVADGKTAGTRKPDTERRDAPPRHPRA